MELAESAKRSGSTCPGIVLAFAVEGLAHFLPIPKSLPMDKFFNDATSAYLMAFFGILVAPVLEELFFRGMLYPTLRRGLGTCACACC